MPRSILLGRPWPELGEPLFLPEDTDAVIALAEEEAGECGLCGMPRAICSDPANQLAFEAHARRCWVTQAITQKRSGASRDGVAEHSTTYSARVREGRSITHDDLAALEAPS